MMSLHFNKQIIGRIILIIYKVPKLSCFFDNRSVNFSKIKEQNVTSLKSNYINPNSCFNSYQISKHFHK